MAGGKILNLPYLIPRVFIWVLLFSVALFDALKHRQVKRRGSQLQRGLIAVVFAYVVQDVLLLTFSILNDQKSPKASPVCVSYIFFTDLADTLMIVSALSTAGLSITVRVSRLAVQIAYCVHCKKCAAASVSALRYGVMFCARAVYLTQLNPRWTCAHAHQLI